MTPFSKVCVSFICFLFIHDAKADIKVKIELELKNDKPIMCKEVAKVLAHEGDTIQFISVFANTINWGQIFITKKDGRSISLLDKREEWRKIDTGNGDVIFALPNVTTNYSGNWTFNFLTLKNIKPQKEPIKIYENNTYTEASCDIAVEIKPQDYVPLWVYISVGVGILVIIVILAQTAAIIYLKKKEQSLLRSANFKPGNKVGSDGARYSLTPGQRAAKTTRRGDSGIYETLEDIRLQNNAAPPPPAIDTLPRKGGSNKLEKAPLLPTIPSSPEDDRNISLELSRLEAERIKNRPPLSLPCEETYEEVENEDNTYEPPPMIPPAGHIRARPAIANKLPAVFPIPLTSPGQQMERPSQAKRPEIPAKAEKPKPAKASKPAKPEKPPKIERPAKVEKPAKAEKPPKVEKHAKPAKPEKPAIKPKKSGPNTSVAGELDSILKKRRNDSNPPMMVNELDSILKKRRDVAANKPAEVEPIAAPPPAAVPSLPRITPKSPVIQRPSASNNRQTRKPPAPLPVTKPPLPDPEPVPLHVTSQNDEPNSSDEEWTYEALPQYNIYSI